MRVPRRGISRRVELMVRRLAWGTEHIDAATRVGVIPAVGQLSDEPDAPFSLLPIPPPSPSEPCRERFPPCSSGNSCDLFCPSYCSSWRKPGSTGVFFGNGGISRRSVR